MRTIAIATQLSLACTGRGGYRPGSGRKRNPSASYVPHHARPKLGARFPVHVTLKLLPHVGNLRTESRRRLLEGCLGAGRERETFRLVHFSIQEDHVHMLAEAKDAPALARGIQGLAIRVAKALNRSMGTRGRVFKDRYHMRILRTPTEVRNALCYVLNNGASHAARRGLRFVGQEPDPCSSGRFFDGWARVDWKLPQPDPSPTPVCRPRTWLLAKGWRLRGLIALGEVSAASRAAGLRRSLIPAGATSPRPTRAP